jgi:hypothetical protein
MYSERREFRPELILNVKERRKINREFKLNNPGIKSAKNAVVYVSVGFGTTLVRRIEKCDKDTITVEGVTFSRLTGLQVRECTHPYAMTAVVKIRPSIRWGTKLNEIIPLYFEEGYEEW